MAPSDDGNPIRIALLTPTLLMGGAERWLISLARCCDRRRIEWTGTALSHGAAVHPDLCREMSAYMPVYAGPEAAPLEDSIRRCPSARTALQTVLTDADVLITWGLPNLGDLVRGYTRPVVLVSHGGGEWARWTVRSSEAAATHLVAVSETARLAFSPEYHDRVAILHNGIDVQRCTPTIPRQQMRAVCGFADHHRLIGYVGRYSPEKNPTAAACVAHHLGGNYRAVYAGSGWQEAEVRRRVQQIAGSRACFIPMDRQVGNALSALDVFVLASPAEGFSLALAEAWYCGVPVVATRVGAVPELEAFHGPLVSPVEIHPSPEALAQAVEYALTPAFRSDVVPRACEAVAQHYTSAVMGQCWTDYLCAICGGGPAANGRPNHR
jgi:glycosyltransferase involved in cell wall biosynthesis